MTQLETLIQTLCPNGVKRYKLKEIAEMQRGTSITKKDDHTYYVEVPGSEFLILEFW